MRQRGFTLIEALVVVVILGLLAAVMVFAVGGIDGQGADERLRGRERQAPGDRRRGLQGASDRRRTRRRSRIS